MLTAKVKTLHLSNARPTHLAALKLQSVQIYIVSLNISAIQTIAPDYRVFNIILLVYLRSEQMEKISKKRNGWRLKFAFITDNSKVEGRWS